MLVLACDAGHARPAMQVSMCWPSPISAVVKAVGLISSQACGGREQSSGGSEHRGNGAVLLPLN